MAIIIYSNIENSEFAMILTLTPYRVNFIVSILNSNDLVASSDLT